MKKVMVAALVMLSGVLAQGEELVFGTQEFPPFSVKTADGNAAGPGVDIIKAVCAEANIPCSFKIGVWKGIQQVAQSEGGEINGLFFLGKNAAREEWMYFSPTVLDTAYGFFAKSTDSLAYLPGTDLEGGVVGVYGPSNTSKSLQTIKDDGGNFTTEVFKDSATVFRVLSQGTQLRFAYSNRDVGAATLKELGITDVKYIGDQKPVSYYISFSKKKVSEETYNKFVSAFNKLKESGKIKEILDEYGIAISK